MDSLTFISWNVNGIKSTIKQGGIDFLNKQNPDFICLQEIKTHYTELDDSFPDYFPIWNPAERKGYSGTLIYSKRKPVHIEKVLGISEHDDEGRLTTIELDNFYLSTIYTVNAQRGLKRLDYRMKWDEEYLSYIKKLDKKKPVILCGDYNVAHTEIDLANPKSNKRNAGFTPQERDGFSKFIDNGFVDTFRHFNKEPGHYTWWSVRTNSRAKNIGWRLDYFLVSERIIDKVQSSEILSDVYGSDHCPIKLTLTM